MDNSINAAIRKLRSAFRDTPVRSSFIRTITGKGYLFVAPMEVQTSRVEGKNKRAMLAVLPFENISGDPEQEYSPTV